jgi:YesN/AraC family two-component response regulator
MDYKECSYCSEDKDLKDFRIYTNGKPYSHCLDCEKFVRKKYRDGSKKEKECTKCKCFKALDSFGNYKSNNKKTVCRNCEESAANKKCNNCGEIKKVINFRLRKHNNTYYSRCIPCEREQTRTRRARNRKTSEEIYEDKKKQDSMVIKTIIKETGISKQSAKKAFARYEQIIVSEFSHIIDVPDHIEKKTLKHVISLVKNTKNSITKGTRMEVEKKVTDYIKKNEKNGLTLKDIDQFRKECHKLFKLNP